MSAEAITHGTILERVKQRIMAREREARNIGVFDPFPHGRAMEERWDACAQTLRWTLGVIEEEEKGQP